MLSSPYNVEQINKEYICSLSMSLLIRLCEQLTSDLKKAHDRLNQTPQNSSKPPSSQPPWSNSQPDYEGGSELNESENNFLLGVELYRLVRSH